MSSITVDLAALEDSRAGQSFDTIRKCVGFFGVVCAIVLAASAVLAFLHQPVTAFMWVRGGILLAVGPLLLGWAAKAARGEARAFDRLSTVSAVLPVSIVAVDLIPGICPPWYAVLQSIGALPLVGVAVLTRSSQLRAAFRKAK
jgi:hypothetical protein